MPPFDVIEIKKEYRGRLAELVEQHGVALKRAGRWLMGRCPFHEDGRPSFAVNLDGEYWRCFACGKHGDVVAFIQEKCALSFPAALEYLAEGVGAAPTVETFQRSAQAAPPPPTVSRPPEVDRFWRRCLAVTGDRSLVAWLKSRGLDAAAIARLDLARRVPEGGTLPAWLPEEWVKRKGHRLVVPVYDGKGQLATVRLRSTYRRADPKTRAVLGHTQGRAVMADRLGAWMLSGSEDARRIVEHVGIYVAEGEPDFFTLASLTPEHGWAQRTRGDRHPAVFGLFQSAWCDEIAERIPKNATVTIWPHVDPPGPSGVGVGYKYAGEVRASLKACGLEDEQIRWVQLTQATDVNELHLMALERRKPPQVLAATMPDLDASVVAA